MNQSSSSHTPLNSKKLELNFSQGVAELQAEVALLSEAFWTNHVNQQNYVGKWDVAPLRCLQQHVNAHAILQSFAIESGENWINLPVLESLPHIKRILEALDCPRLGSRLMRLHPGAYIKPHRDRGLAFEFGEVRLHIPINTSDKIGFNVNDQFLHMCAGEVWYINADQIHWVKNSSLSARSHLVVDCVVNDWLRERLV